MEETKELKIDVEHLAKTYGLQLTDAKLKRSGGGLNKSRVTLVLQGTRR